MTIQIECHQSSRKDELQLSNGVAGYRGKDRGHSQQESSSESWELSNSYSCFGVISTPWGPMYTFETRALLQSAPLEWSKIENSCTTMVQEMDSDGRSRMAPCTGKSGQAVILFSHALQLGDIGLCNRSFMGCPTSRRLEGCRKLGKLCLDMFINISRIMY